VPSKELATVYPDCNESRKARRISIQTTSLSFHGPYCTVSDSITNVGSSTDEVTPLLVKLQPAEAESSFTSVRRSLSGTINSAFPQVKQRNSSGNTQTMGLLRPSSPCEWMATSAVNLRCLSDPHHLHVMSPSFLTRIDLDCVATTNR
jgi:hypothetical protein